MNIVLCSTGGKSEQFWRIETAGTFLMVNYGKWNSDGKTDLKEFETEQLCEKQAEKLVLAKKKKGYEETEDFDAEAHRYFDAPDSGPHPLTSHPTFRKYFSDEIYYDCVDEYAPFGNDTGSDVLSSIQAISRKYPRYNAKYFMSELIEKEWQMPSLLPTSFYSDTQLRSLTEADFNGISGGSIMRMTDQAMIAMVLAMIRINGYVMKTLADDALRSLDRMQAMEQLYPEETDEAIIPYIQRMRHDLRRFIADTFHGSYYAYVRDLSAGSAARIREWLAQGTEAFRISDLSDGQRTAQEIYEITEDILRTGYYPSVYKNLCQASFDLAILFGQALCNGYGWEWKMLGEDATSSAFGVVSPEGQYSHIPRVLFERILIHRNHYGADGENDNTVLLLYNMLDGIDSRPAPERFYPIL